MQWGITFMPNDPVPSRPVEYGHEAPAAARAPSSIEATPPTPRRRWSLRKRVFVLVLGLLLLYGAVTYLIIPAVWNRYERRHPALDDVPGITQTGTGIPGDPINVERRVPAYVAFP